ncbi:MAG: hypothetical protein U5L02_15320 [Rheinheimera sp.]|nr:hypothetical protein [Rheinheimera sp.]
MNAMRLETAMNAAVDNDEIEDTHKYSNRQDKIGEIEDTHKYSNRQDKIGEIEDTHKYSNRQDKIGDSHECSSRHAGD